MTPDPSPAEQARTVLDHASLLDLRLGGRPPEPVEVRAERLRLGRGWW